MIESLEVCKTKHHGTVEQVECCYQVCLKFWEKIKNIAIQNTFSSLTDEIEFYKSLKPAFTSEIEYYGLVYHAHLFRPDLWGNLLGFFLRESQRLPNFIKENYDFYCYYKNQREDLDHAYFTKTAEDSENITIAKAYDIYGSVVSGADHLVATILSLEKYHQYVQLEIEKIGKL